MNRRRRYLAKRRRLLARWKVETPKKVCAWCNPPRRTSGRPVSHTICKSCDEREKALERAFLNRDAARRGVAKFC